jgi:hypothetical protein
MMPALLGSEEGLLAMLFVVFLWKKWEISWGGFEVLV